MYIIRIKFKLKIEFIVHNDIFIICRLVLISYLFFLLNVFTLFYGKVILTQNLLTTLL